MTELMPDDEFYDVGGSVGAIEYGVDSNEAFAFVHGAQADGSLGSSTGVFSPSDLYAFGFTGVGEQMGHAMQHGFEVDVVPRGLRCLLIDVVFGEGISNFLKGGVYFLGEAASFDGHEQGGVKIFHIEEGPVRSQDEASIGVSFEGDTETSVRGDHHLANDAMRLVLSQDSVDAPHDIERTVS